MTPIVTFSENELRALFDRLLPMLDEQQRRVFVGAVVDQAGRGYLKLISKLANLSQPTVIRGRTEYRDQSVDLSEHRQAQGNVRIRKEGGGRKSITKKNPGIEKALLEILDGSVVGNPENPIYWTTKSTYTIAKLLKEKGFDVCPNSVAKLLKELDFSLQQNRKYVERGGDSPDRNQQFNFISEQCKEFAANNCPVISIDAKKKELIGNYKNNGSEYREHNNPRKVNDHDFEGEGGKATPYGIYDINANEGFVNVGISTDTAEFATESIRRWWNTMGKQRYPNAEKLMITADCGGSNGARLRLWKVCLQELANETGLEIHVCHFPPGTSKWNKIEHQLFAQISRCWRGQPLETLAILISLISATTTDTGLSVKCELDTTEYMKGIKISDEDLAAVRLERNEWRGDWNYTIHPVRETAI